MEISVATYNILHSYNLENIALNLKKIAGEGVAIFALQEVSKTEGKKFIGDEILKVLGKNYKAEFSLTQVLPHIFWGTGVIYNSEKIHLLKARKIIMSQKERLSFKEQILSRIIMGGKGILYHRSFLNCKFSYNNRIFYFSSIHPDFFGDIAFRNDQLKDFLEKRMKPEQEDPEIICGDFNNIDLLHIGSEQRLIRKTLGDGFFDATESISRSVDIFNVSANNATPIFLLAKKANPFHLYRKIDYIWAKNFIAENAKSYNLEGSDHLPLSATLKFN